MEVSILIPLFNRLDLTRACLESLERTLRRWRYEVILVDDGSTDGTRDFLRTLPAPRYRVVCNDAPLGYAANNNLGARLARAPLLCLLNNDTVLRPGWLEPMARAASLLPGVACVGNVQREPVSGLIDHHGIYFDAEGMPLHAGRHTPAPPAEPYLEWPAVTAACCVVRRRAFLRLGGFDEAFRNGFEDVDLCLRAHERGYRHFVANRSEIFHHVSASPGRKIHEAENLRRFQERWGEFLASGSLARRTPASERAAGWRSLRAGLGEPGRYTLRQGRRAVGQMVWPRPGERRLPAPARGWLQLEDTVTNSVRRILPGRRPKTQGYGLTVPVFVVAGQTAQDPACTGVNTVVRRLAGALGQLQARVRLIHWQAPEKNFCGLPPGLSLGQAAEGLRTRPEDWSRQKSFPSLFDPSLSRPDGLFASATPLHRLPTGQRPPPGSWIVLPEIPPTGSSGDLVAYAHRHGWRLAAVLHDALATNEPQHFPPEVPDSLARHLRAMSEADLVLPVSDFTAHDWRLFVAAKSLPSPPATVCKPGADSFLAPRATVGPTLPPAGAPVRLLCVSAVAPCKGHRALLDAYELVVAAQPDLRLELCCVGDFRPGPDRIDIALHEATARHPGRVTWFERVEPGTLRRLYEDSHFTVYPSILEGFGLPILESLWCGRPCICADFGAPHETAWGGGCLTTDVRDPQALASAILALAACPQRLADLAAEIHVRPLRTWSEYAGDLLSILSNFR